MEREINVIVICRPFFGYDNEIRKALEVKYNKVYLFSDVPFLPIYMYRFFCRTIPFLSCFFEYLYAKMLYEIVKRKKVQIMLVIKGEFLKEELLSKITCSTNCEIINYQWDSFKNNPNGIMISQYAMRNYTFDMFDCKQYDTFNYLPLFYNWDGVQKNLKTNKEYDILFLGSWSAKRCDEFVEFSNFCKNRAISVYAHLYLPFHSYVLKFIKKNKHLLCANFCSIGKGDYYRMLNGSSAVLDFPSAAQVGASMKTIEALSLRKKVITTNLNVVNEKFYNKNNILIWPNENDRLLDFLHSPFNDDSLSSLNSIHQWLRVMGL